MFFIKTQSFVGDGLVDEFFSRKDAKKDDDLVDEDVFSQRRKSLFFSLRLDVSA